MRRATVGTRHVGTRVVLPRAVERHAVQRGGVTLLELIVVLAILGVMAAVVGVAVRGGGGVREVDARVGHIASAKHEAIRRGRAVTVQIETDSATLSATALPDGRVLVGRAFQADSSAGGLDAK